MAGKALPLPAALLRGTFVVALLLHAQPVGAQAERDAARDRPTAISGVDVVATAATCTDRDDPRARALWLAMRARNDGGSDTVSMWTAMQSTSGVVAAEQLLRFDTVSTLRPDGSTTGWNSEEATRDSSRHLLHVHRAAWVGPGRRGMAGRYREQGAARIATRGYAVLQRGVSADLTQVSAAWEYPALEAELASHFISEPFGSRTAFQLELLDERTVIAFCSRPEYRRLPHLSGALVLRADTTLERAQWRFRTGDPDEEAGGEVEFPAYRHGEDPPFLLARQGTFYRRDGSRFFHRRQRFFGWMIGERLALPTHLSRERVQATGKIIVRSVSDPQTRQR